MTERPGASIGPSLYWIFVVLLIAIGAIGAIGIGLPFLVLGLVLAALAPVRGRPRLFWPPVVAVVAFFAAWWLLGPVSCTARSTPADLEETTCESLIGVTYEGDPRWVGPGVGLLAAAVLGGATYLGLGRLASRRRD